MLEDHELVERARAGDVAAFEALVVRHQRAAVQVAYALAPGEAEDVAQEAFVKAYRALGRFRPGAPFRPWLLRIVANQARNQRRGSSRRAGLALRVAGQGEAVAPSPEEAVLRGFDRAALVSALGRLGERDRLVLVYRYFVGLSEAEMAQALGCRPGTVKSRVSRALGRLRGLLSEHRSPEPSGAPHD